jgi:hypothetical protein
VRRSGRIRCISDRVGKLEPVQPSLVAAFTEGVPLDSIPLVAEADERHMRAVKRQERFSSEADSETVFLFAEDVKEARSEFLMALEAVFRG